MKFDLKNRLTDRRLFRKIADFEPRKTGTRQELVEAFLAFSSSDTNTKDNREKAHSSSLRLVGRGTFGCAHTFSVRCTLFTCPLKKFHPLNY